MGGAVNIGTGAVVKSSPDGYAAFFVSSAHAINAIGWW